MSRVTTKTALANLAITLIKGNPVANIDPPDRGSKTAKAAAQWYEDTRREVLAETDWDFAIRRAQLAATTPPAFGWSQAYELPTDFIRISTIGDEKNPLTSEYYTIEDGKILCNEPAPLNLRYVSDVQDVAKFSPKFVIAFAKKLSAYLAHALSGSMNMAAGLTELAADDLSTAKSVDAQQNPPRKLETSRWARAKLRGHTERYD